MGLGLNLPNLENCLNQLFCVVCAGDNYMTGACWWQLNRIVQSSGHQGRTQPVTARPQVSVPLISRPVV